MNHKARSKKNNHVILNISKNRFGMTNSQSTGFTTTSVHSCGFTLIELLLVISLIASLGALTTAFMARFLTQNAVSNATDQVVGDFREAQIKAMMGKQNTNWGVAYSSNTIYLYEGTTFSGRNSAFDETFSVSPNVAISGLTDVNFARLTGVPNATPTITISDSYGNSNTLTVYGQGMITR